MYQFKYVRKTSFISPKFKLLNDGNYLSFTNCLITFEVKDNSYEYAPLRILRTNTNGGIIISGDNDEIFEISNTPLDLEIGNYVFKIKIKIGNAPETILLEGSIIVSEE